MVAVPVCITASARTELNQSLSAVRVQPSTERSHTAWPGPHLTKCAVPGLPWTGTSQQHSRASSLGGGGWRTTSTTTFAVSPLRLLCVRGGWSWTGSQLASPVWAASSVVVTDCDTAPTTTSTAPPLHSSVTPHHTTPHHTTNTTIKTKIIVIPLNAGLKIVYRFHLTSQLLHQILQSKIKYLSHTPPYSTEIWNYQVCKTFAQKSEYYNSVFLSPQCHPAFLPV